MKTEEVIFALTAKLPTETEYFSSFSTFSSITLSGSIATYVTNTNHDLTTGDVVPVFGVITPVLIDSFTENAAEIIFETDTAHDLTLNELYKKDREQKVKITNAALDFEQVYRLKRVPNRNTFICFRDNVPALPADTYSLQEQSSAGYNGLKQVTVINDTTFEAPITKIELPEPNDLSSGKVSTGIRISGSVDLQTIIDSYTAQNLNEVWAFAVLSEFAANKDRDNLNDAQYTSGRQMDFRQKIIAGFPIYVVVPNKGNILTDTNGRAARDLIEDVRVPILKSVLGLNFPTDLACQGQNVVTYLSDGGVAYEGAYYIHEFQFQQVIEITSADTAIEEFDRAFRDIDVTHLNQFSDDAPYLAKINLDDEPEA